MDTITKFVCESGIETLLSELAKVYSNNKEFHEVAMENETIDMDDWFVFGWELNQSLSGPRVTDTVFAIPEFNYIAVEKEIVDVVENTNGIHIEELVEEVANRVESATQEDVSEWLEITEVETDDERRITSVTTEYF